jgi:GTPase
MEKDGLMSQRKNYVVLLVVTDDGSHPRIPKGRLMQHVSVDLPTGLSVEWSKVRDEGDDCDDGWHRAVMETKKGKRP